MMMNPYAQIGMPGINMPMMGRGNPMMQFQGMPYGGYGGADYQRGLLGMMMGQPGGVDYARGLIGNRMMGGGPGVGDMYMRAMQGQQMPALPGNMSQRLAMMNAQRGGVPQMPPGNIWPGRMAPGQYGPAYTQQRPPMSSDAVMERYRTQQRGLTPNPAMTAPQQTGNVDNRVRQLMANQNFRGIMNRRQMQRAPGVRVRGQNIQGRTYK